MCDINAEKLIKAMQIRPALYDRNDSMYFSHKKYKSKMWKEVCKEVFSNWDHLRPQDKVEYCHEVMKRWKSLRTCFTRELGLQKKEKLKRERNEGPIKRRKRYEYFNMMRFLQEPGNSDYKETGNTEDNETARDSDESSSDPLNHNTVKTETVYDEPRTSKITIEAEAEQYPHFFERSSNMEEMIVDVLKTIKKDEEDEDRQFMLSLVPSFRKLKSQHKFDARIEILKVLKEISLRD